MGNFNLVIELGRLTREVDARDVGQARVANFGIAVNNTYKRGDQTVDETMFIDVTCWNKTAEIAEKYLKKGNEVLVEGRLKLEQWDDKATGAKRSKHVIVCSRLCLIGGKKNDGERPASDGPPAHDDSEPF